MAPASSTGDLATQCQDYLYTDAYATWLWRLPPACVTLSLLEHPSAGVHFTVTGACGGYRWVPAYAMELNNGECSRSGATGMSRSPCQILAVLHVLLCSLQGITATNACAVAALLLPCHSAIAVAAHTPAYQAC
jgi:hypothetical protein